MPQIGPMSFKCRQPPSLAVSPFLAVVLPPSPSLSLSRVISQQAALSQFGCTLGLGSSALLQTVSHQCATARHYRLQFNCHTPQGTLSKGTNPASTPSPPTLAFKKKEKKTDHIHAQSFLIRPAIAMAAQNCRKRGNGV